MPREEDDWSSYNNFRIVFWIMLTGLCITWISSAWTQCDVDIFMIDWEKNRLVTDEQKKLITQDPDVNKGSVWRSLLVANEFSECICQRYINIEL